MGKAKQIKGVRLVGMCPDSFISTPSRMLEVDQPGFVRMKFQPEPAHPLGQHLQHTLDISQIGKYQYEIIGIANQEGWSV